MPTDVDQLITPPTPTAAAALRVVRQWSSPELADHCLRSWAFAALLAPRLDLEPDRELLFVAAMLHDLGVTPHFDAHHVAFETAGGAVGAVFAAGAGWDEHRAQRVHEIIERHMWRSVDPDVDVEGHLLEVATGLDVSGVGFQKWDENDLRAITRAIPRRDFSQQFAESIHDQAIRKPTSQAARLDESGRVLSGRKAWQEFLDD